MTHYQLQELKNADKLTNHCRVLVTSIGTAKPSTSAAIASGLNLPVSKVISCLYRAPSVLADGLEEKLAKKIVSVLLGVGYEAEAQRETEPYPQPALLYDVALYVKDAEKTHSITDVVSRFTGMTVQAAYDMILKPPGIVLGGVSEATIMAFEKQFGDEVSVMWSRPQNAEYDIFVSNGSEVLRKRIMQDLESLKLPLLSSSGLVLTNVNYDIVRNLWQRYQAGGMLHIVNQDFMRFDLILESQNDDFFDSQSFDDDEAKKATILDVFSQHTDVPNNMIDDILHALPLTIIEGLSAKELPEKMSAFYNAGLQVRSEMITFQMVKLVLLSCGNKDDLRAVLRHQKIIEDNEMIPALPFELTEKLPELYARIVKSLLEEVDVEVEFSEGSV